MTPQQKETACMPPQNRTQVLFKRAIKSSVKWALAQRMLWWSPIMATILVTVLTLGASAQNKPATGLTASVNVGTGDYSVTSRALGWQFRGSVGSPLKNVVRATGRDTLGSFHSIRFDWSGNGVPITGQIKTYDLRPIARFQLTYDKPTQHPALSFPNFTSLPTGLYPFSYREFRFAPPQFAAGNYGTPWLLFDDHFDGAILSPAGGFQVTVLSGDGQNTAGVSLRGTINSVPAGYSVNSLLVLDKGIADVFNTWGAALNLIQGRSRPSNEADTSLRYLGYWTDAGAHYYYNFEPQLGYAGTLQQEIQHLHSNGIAVRYLQLDSWWYQKDNLGPDGQPLQPRQSNRPSTRPVFPPARWNITGGAWLYEASHTLFPKGLDAFHQQLGLPFIAHARYIGQDSPYHDKYRIAGIAPIDPNYWQYVAAYLRNNGVFNYEQDWLGYIRQYSGFDTDLRVGEEFFDNMAAAMKAQGLTMQYCSAEPDMFLQGTRYSNLTTIRVSNDRFVRARWHDFLFTSQLAGALSVWPFADNATSQDVNAMLLQALSAGPVGFGDEMGQENRENLMRTARADGVIVKPDAPLIPVDRDYLDGALGRHVPMLGYTHSKEGGVTTAYVFAFAPTPQDQGPVEFQASDVGLRGKVAVYDYFAHRLTVVPAGGSFHGDLENDQASYYVLATPGRSGIAFLGDQDDFVGSGRMRISDIADSAKQLTVTVLFAQGENNVTLHGYAQFEPQVSVRSGKAEPVHYDSSTGEFNVAISPNLNTPLISQNSWQPRVRNVVVTLRKP